MNKQNLKLFILGYTPIAMRAIKNLEMVCGKPEISALYNIQIINLYDNPEYAEQEKILATPLLIIHKAHSNIRIIGDLSNSERVSEVLTTDLANNENK